MRLRSLGGVALFLASAGSGAEIIDHHQHLYSPEAGVRSSPGPAGIPASELIRRMDEAGISRAVVLSVSYSFANPNRPPVKHEYAHVKAENDWTSAQVARYPARLRGFCSVNPLKPYAAAEIARCAKDPNLRAGVKLHFGNSDVDLANPGHVARLRRVFRTANHHHMAIAVHVHPSVTRHRPYGAMYARLFLDRLAPEAPDVTIQIAHLAGPGGYDSPAIDEAIEVYVNAIAKGDARMRNVYFDVSGVAGLGQWREQADRIAARLRQLGLNRILYGSDAPLPGNYPKETLKAFRELPLTAEEFRMIENNSAPYLKDWIESSRR